MKTTIITLVGLFLGALSSLAAAAEPCQAEPLSILLTNDDGYDTIGIVALHRALKNAGHHVKRIAPERNYSGSSTSLTLDLIKAPQVADTEFSEVFAVTGSPATSVLLGASAIFTPEKPAQLVISGINDGANLGPATPISGTVGATIAAIKVLNPPLPAIAISTNMPAGDSGREKLAHVANVADFVKRLLDRLQCAQTRWSDTDMALNVNYPPLEPASIKGVRLASQGRSAYFRIGFTATGDGHFVPSFGAAETTEDAPSADTVLFNAGYVTVVPVDGDYTAADATLPAGLEAIAP